MPTTKPKSISLTLRLTPDELTLIDDTCEYLEKQGTNVLGTPTFSRADAVRKLVAHGYKHFQRARRAEARASAAPAGEQEDDAGTSEPAKAAGASAPLAPPASPVSGFARLQLPD